MSENRRCVPIIGDLALLEAIAKDHPGIGPIALKGCEAAGFVGAETTLILYAAAWKILRAFSESPDILIWGGVSTPEAAAAFLTTGASGIVFESVHWLTDLVAIDDLQRDRLSRLRTDSTELAGLDLEVPCRLFNKGNSLAFKRIKALEDSLGGAEITEESRRSFVSQVRAQAVHPLESRFTPAEVILLGVEAAFAASFAERFGTGTEKAVQAFMAEIRSSCRAAELKKDGFLGSPVAGEMGITYPFVQGAMTSITDIPEFALKVAEAGALPTIALGLMGAETLDRKLGRLPEIMAGHPYAVNVIFLAENPCLEAQLAWIKEHRPRFVWIAGGDLSPARELLECGIEVAYLAPDEALLGLALESGVRFVVCEGYEAGGHVGRHSTLTLAQIVLDLKRRKPSLFRDCRVIIAGGIFDRRTAFMAAVLGADAIQMGTVYLATREIVETGALTALYQRMIVESKPGETLVSGQSTGLRVRSLKTPRLTTVLALEREFATGRQDELSFRMKMEQMAAGSLFAAARGFDRSSGMPLDEQASRERGQFMSGACAGLIGKVRDLPSLHRELAEGPLSLIEPFAGPSSRRVEQGPARVAPAGGSGERIAITGMSIVNALGQSPEEIWAASLAKESGITLVPPARWDHSLFYDPRPRVTDKTYCQVGAFVDFHASRQELGISPQDFRTMTSATRLTLWLAQKAIRASGLLESGIPRERIAVLISQNSGEAAGTLTDMIIREYVHEIVSAVQRALPLTADQEKAVEREVKSGRMAPDDSTLLGRLNCTAAGFICNRYGFMGPSYAVSAACASSLVALWSALQMIRNGIIDAAIVGGGEDNLTHLHFLEFSAVGALYGLSGRSRPPRETSRPFDAERDGMVLGEGGGMIVIERESLARRRGAPVHALITGMGASNNHLGLVESSSVTQEIAIRESFRGTPYGPEAVDLVECHATSTRQGDVEEVRALRTFFSSSKRTVLTSFKSQIGHTLGASGMNDLIRGIMAMKAGVFPPTLNYTYPDPEIDLDGSGLVIAKEPFDWNVEAGRPRRVQVNAFGFGGSNYVVQVEQALDEADAILVAPEKEPGLAPGKVAGAAAVQGVSFFRTKVDGRSSRMAVLARSDREALAVIERSASLAEGGSVSPKALRSLAQQGIFVSPEDLPAPPLAFVFPGQGSHYEGMGRDLYKSFPVIKEWMDRAAAAMDFDLLKLLFHDREQNLLKTRWQQPALFAVEHALARYLIGLGIRPVAMAGHSLGELTALCLAGVYSLEDGIGIVNMRARCMDKVAARLTDPGVMAAVDAPLDVLREMITGQEGVQIANINAPNQVVLSGDTEAVKALGQELKTKGYRFTLLRVSMAFHSRVMRTIRDEMEAFVAPIPFHSPQIPVISNTTGTAYPSDPGEIKRILMAHLESPVHWMDNVRTLWSRYGVRLFVEAGPGDILSSLITDTLPESTCLPTCLPSAEGLTCKTALARLFVQGHLEIPEEPRFVSLPASRNKVPPGKPASAAGEAPGRQDLTKRLIRIIMEATGFERDEIKPDMDLRKDLSIRSSRLPIIMDAAERQFGITIELEDFIRVRTVDDIAQKIAETISRQHETGLPPAAKAPDAGPEQGETPRPPDDEAGLRRLVFGVVPMEYSAPVPLEMKPGESVLLLSPGKDDDIAGHAGDILRQDYGVDTIPLRFMKGKPRRGEEGGDILTDEGSVKVSERISGLAPLAGLVITLPGNGPGRLRGMEDVSRLFRGFVLPLKAFLESPAGKFVVLIHDRENAETLGGLLVEGILGMFLSAAREHSSVLFRTLEIGRETDLRAALGAALDRGYGAVEMIHRDGRVFTSEGHVAPSVFGHISSMDLSPGDVLVISGGATGISAALARSLVPFRPRLVFLGRTCLDQGVDPAKPRPGSLSPEAATCDTRASEIARTLADLRSAGIEASYYTCDVADPVAVRGVLGEVAVRYGRIDGIIHGAGILRDGFLSLMTPDDLSAVADVKFLGAWNLFSAAEGAGLRFFVALSSAAAIQGNLGQSNYAAANRMMSALLRYLRRKNAAIRFKALMLPPVEGTGMADDPEVRELLRHKGVAYIHVNELAGLFCRELFTASADDVWVMFMRRLPAVRTGPLNDSIPPSSGGELEGGTVSFSPEEFPMIERVSCLDFRREELEAARSFSQEKDLWIPDHRPFKFIKQPLVSAAMVLETFMEAARILYPYLQVRGVRQVRLLDMIQCPPGVPRPATISCRRTGNGLPEVVCEVSLSTPEISPTGRLADPVTPNFTGQVILDGGERGLGEGIQDEPVRPAELRMGPLDHETVLKWYQDRSGLQGRYRVIESIEGAGPGVVRGHTTYRETSDFADLQNVQYQYSPYLFEALMQVVGFHTAAMDPSERRSIIPVEIGEMRFSRKCRVGERITLEARRRAQDENGFFWDAKGIDDQGRTIMQVHDMHLKWVSD
ncbi:MAG: SDR family NAD(P)-dependent oxidoreductase [Candidatus Aminicenantales bacterium]